MKNLLKHTASVLQMVETTDSKGAVCKNYTTKISTLQCSIQPVSRRESKNNSRIEADETYMMYCPYNSNLLLTDRIVYNNEVFEILNIKNPAGLNRHLEVELKKR